MKSLKAIWQDIRERVHEGDRNEARLVKRATKAILADAELTRLAVDTLTTKRVRDIISDTVKPAGLTSRVPAGQGSFGWVEMKPEIAMASLRLQVKYAYKAMARAQRHAEIIGIIDASGLDPASFQKFGELCTAANVPEELVEALAA